MKDFVTCDLRSELTRDQLFEKLTLAMPEFKWRRGDSDAQGHYISGMTSDSVQVQVWLEEEPIEMSVSFSGAWAGASDRESRKRRLMDTITKTLIPSIGSIVKIDA